MPSRRTTPRRFPLDAIVYLATLAVGSALVLVGHVSPQDLAGYATALTSLYAAWRHHQPAPPQRPAGRRPPRGRTRANSTSAGGNAEPAPRRGDSDAAK